MGLINRRFPSRDGSTKTALETACLLNDPDLVLALCRTYNSSLTSDTLRNALNILTRIQQTNPAGRNVQAIRRILQHYLDNPEDQRVLREYHPPRMRPSQTRDGRNRPISQMRQNHRGGGFQRDQLQSSRYARQIQNKSSGGSSKMLGEEMITRAESNPG